MQLVRDVRLLAVAALAGLGIAMIAREERAQAPQHPFVAGVGNGLGDIPDPDRRGRGARSPRDLPARGWWQIAKRVYNKISDDRVLAEAAGVTFYVLLAIFPALAALVSLYGLFADPSTVQSNIDTLRGLVPEGGMQILDEQTKSLSSHGGTTLGIGVLFGLLVSLWSANSGMKALFDALNIVYEEKEKRTYIRRTLVSLAFTLSSLVFVILVMGAVVVAPLILGWFGLGGTTDLLLKVTRWPVMLLITAGFLSVVYRYGPSRLQPRWQWVSWGAIFAALVWALVSGLFSFYVANFGSYNKTYGSLGAAVGFMTWIWISTIVVLVGAEVNAEMEHQTARDTTIGREKPLGRRHAVKADTVAA